MILPEPRIGAGSWKESDRVPRSGRGGMIGEARTVSWVELVRIVVIDVSFTIGGARSRSRADR